MSTFSVSFFLHMGYFKSHMPVCKIFDKRLLGFFRNKIDFFMKKIGQIFMRFRNKPLQILGLDQIFAYSITWLMSLSKDFLSSFWLPMFWNQKIVALDKSHVMKYANDVLSARNPKWLIFKPRGYLDFFGYHPCPVLIWTGLVLSRVNQTLLSNNKRTWLHRRWCLSSWWKLQRLVLICPCKFKDSVPYI